MRRAPWLGILVLAVLGACADETGEAQDLPGDVASSDVAPADAPDAPDAALDAAPEDAGPCAKCGDGTYCNFGECVPTTIVFPRDAGPHTDRSEWWYYTGHLLADGREWGFEATIFQYDLSRLFGEDEGMGFMCHVAVTDVTDGEHYHVDTVSLEAQEWSSSPVVLEVDLCRFELDGQGRDHVVASIPAGQEKDGKASPWVLDLAFDPQKRPARHGGDGIIPMAAKGGNSWYYSYTRLAAEGTLTTPTGDHAVTGQAWMDHQWGQFDIEDFKGWDWWSLQFEDGHEIMLFVFTDWDGQRAVQAGTIVDPDGNVVELEGLDAFTITPRRTWDSPHTDGVYPLDWDIVIPQGDWRLAVTTAIDDQEMYNVAQSYWEGNTVVTGTRDGTPVGGVGYTELTGYATDFLDPK